MGPETDGQSLVMQAVIYIAGAIAAVVFWLVGGKGKDRDHDDGDDERKELQAMLRKLDRAQTTSDIQDLRMDLEKVIASFRESNSLQLAGLATKQELHELRSDVQRSLERFYDRINEQLNKQR